MLTLFQTVTNSSNGSTIVYKKTSLAKQIKGFIDQHAGANTKVKHLVENQLF